jgi:tetratricopeptide (TPR) repeat protein
MARKKRPGEDRPGKRRRPKPAPPELPDVPDPRAMEARMWGDLREVGPAGSPPARAQDLLDRAFAERDPRRRVTLARQALGAWPDSADAYVLLAENAPNRREALRLYEQAVAAGERALGPEFFREAAGHFWGVLETRPYMRARLGLALALWTAGRREESVGHLEDMLRLNPNDNQGVRYTLAGCLLSLDRDDGLARLLDQYPDEGSATWAYTRALLAFRRQGDSAEARQLLRRAVKVNRHVPDYLLGREVLPDEQPGYYSPGDRSEALDYLAGSLAAWKDTPGAVDWLRANSPKGAERKADGPTPKGPLGVVKKWLKQKLPQGDDTWQADARQLPSSLRIAGDRVRPWLVLVTSRTDDLVLAHEVLVEEPTPAHLWDCLVRAMQHPLAGGPHRPAELQVRPGGPWEALRGHVEEVGVRLVPAEDLDQMDGVFAGLSERLVGPPRPGLLEVPGVTAEQAAGFYDAAAFYFRQAPWRRVGYESAIRVECAKYSGGPWYAVVMGQSGVTRGLALYEDYEVLRRGWEGPMSSEEHAWHTVSTSVIYGDEDDLPPADAEAIRRHGWPVARPDAYPWVMHKEVGKSFRRPLAWELELTEGCLRAVPEFVGRRAQDDATAEEMGVRVASGELKLVLAWVPEGEG